MDKDINENFSDRVLTIKLTEEKIKCYQIKETYWFLEDWMIDCLIERPTPIQNRFEILDL